MHYVRQTVIISLQSNKLDLMAIHQRKTQITTEPQTNVHYSQMPDSVIH